MGAINHINSAMSSTICALTWVHWKCKHHANAEIFKDLSMN
jgi:hypothetical protein